MKSYALAALCVAIPSLIYADTTLLNTENLPGKTVYEAAKLIPLAMNSQGKPQVVLLEIANGQEVPAHATDTGLRLISVLKGDVAWGDGDVMDKSTEITYPQGSLLMLPPGVPHWLAARNGDVVLQLVILDETAPTPAIKEQMQ